MRGLVPQPNQHGRQTIGANLPNCRRGCLALSEPAFVTAGLFAGLSGALLAPLEQTVSPSTAHWTKSAEPVMATLIGGPLSFLGPIVGAVVYLGLKEIIVRFTEYWLLVFGLVLLATVLTFRGGLMGALTAWLLRRQRP